MANTISHAFVVPDENFIGWFQALQAYRRYFERVTIVRSPGGNDLNRYRNVTAIAAPGTWVNNSPLGHIRRFYPLVVRVDVIAVTTPQQLRSVLQQRITDDDRYGEQTNSPRHIFDRFVLDWMSTHRPMQIVDSFRDAPGFADDNPGFDILTVPGAQILAGAAGRVTRQWQGNISDALNIGNYVQVTRQTPDATYIVTYAGLRSIAVPLNTLVEPGDILGEVQGNQVRIIVQQPPFGLSGFELPNIVNPMQMIYVENLQLRPTDNGLRVRSLPDVIRGKELRQIHRADTVETREFHGRMLSKVGKQGNWLSIKVPGAERGYVAAWFMEAETPRPDKFSGVNITGVNLDAFHHLGIPDPNWLGNIGWVRFGYNVSAQTGSEDIQAAYDRYAPLFDAYVRAGYRVCVTTSHQTYGELKGEFPLGHMNDGHWQLLIARKADMMSRIAQQWSGKGLINCWQIWNEPDAVIGAEASIAMPPHIYRLMLAGIIPAMRATDPQAHIITAGFTGSQMGSNYARQAIAGLPTNALPEGIALHPYGLTARGSDDPFGFFGSIDSALTDYGSVMPDKKLWITEWGVNRNEDRPPQEIGDYAMAMVNHINAYYRAQIAALIWYPWAQGMHSAYGIVDNQSQSRPGLTERFLKA